MPHKVIPELYGVWQSMRRRCLTPTSKAWPDYGGRGIKICEQWSDYSTFARDMGPRPPGTSIERIDNDGGYSPENCCWGTRKEQQRNRRVTRKVIIEGKEYLAVALSEECGVKTDAIVSRAEKGMSFSEVTAKGRYFGPPNWKKAVAKRVANQRARTHCGKGHELTEQNTYVSPQGWRLCRQCQNAKMRRRTAEKRARQTA